MVKLVRMFVLFCFVLLFEKSHFFLLLFPFRCQVKVFSCEISAFSRLKWALIFLSIFVSSLLICLYLCYQATVITLSLLFFM